MNFGRYISFHPTFLSLRRDSYGWFCCFPVSPALLRHPPLELRVFEETILFSRSSTLANYSRAGVLTDFSYFTRLFFPLRRDSYGWFCCYSSFTRPFFLTTRQLRVVLLFSSFSPALLCHPPLKLRVF